MQMKKTITLILAVVTLFAFTSCKKDIADTTTAAEESADVQATEFITAEPTQIPLNKMIFYVSIMSSRDFTLPLDEKGNDYTSGDLIIQLDPATQTIKVIDIAWLMGIPLSDGQLVPAFYLGNQLTPAQIAGELSQALGIEFDGLLFLNFKAIETAIDMAGGVTSDIPQEIIDDESFNDYTENINYMAPDINKPETLSEAGSKLLSGAQIINLVYSMPKSITEATGESHAVITIMNNFIGQRSQRHKDDYIKVIRALDENQISQILLAMSPDMNISVYPDEYLQLALLIAASAEGEPEIMRLPEEGDYELVDSDIAVIMQCDMDAIRQKLKDFLSD